MKCNSDICVVGSINCDMVTKTPYIPKMGETINGLGFNTYSGGKGANQAVAAARLGANVTIVGCVGNDSFGKALVNGYKKDNINTSCISQIPDVTTGVATIVVCGGDNMIILENGANYKVTSEIVDKFETQIAKSDMIILQNEIPHETNEYIMKKFGKKINIMYNPAPSRDLNKKLFPYINVLIVNEHECGDILKCSIQTSEDAERGIKSLQNMGIKNVVVTLGSKGCVFNDGNSILTQSAVKVEAVDTTSAGDSFCGALAYRLTCGEGMKKAIEYATYVSALTVTKNGAQASLPYANEVDKFMQEKF